MDDGFDPDSAETLARAAAGDQRAVRALYRAHVERVHRHVARILGAHDPDVEDVVQRVFLAALDGAGSFGGRSKVGTWLLGIATRRALDEARARWRRDRWGRISHAVGIGRPAVRPDVRHEARTSAEALLQELNPDQRTVFVLKEVEGHTLQEIKEMTGVGISTLHARLKAARKKLDAALAEGGSHAG
ncbi:MAG: RNA polymerase sigma factor [Myxococcota bacterium]